MLNLQNQSASSAVPPSSVCWLRDTQPYGGCRHFLSTTVMSLVKPTLRKRIPAPESKHQRCRPNEKAFDESRCRRPCIVVVRLRESPRNKIAAVRRNMFQRPEAQTAQRKRRKRKASSLTPSRDYAGALASFKGQEPRPLPGSNGAKLNRLSWGRTDQHDGQVPRWGTGASKDRSLDALQPISPERALRDRGRGDAGTALGSILTWVAPACAHAVMGPRPMM